MRNERVLILTSNYGEGHEQAAKAINETLQILYPNIKGMLVDFMELTHPYVHPVSRYFFINGMKRFPAAYGYLYNKTRSNSPFSLGLKKLNRYGLGRLLKLIQSINPSIVVSTFPLAAGAMSILKEHGLSNVPTATIITDHTDHSYWVYPYTDRYIVGSDYVQRGLQKYQIPYQQISVTGIPIRLEFSRPYNRNMLIHKHGLDYSLPTLLLMGGGCGLFEEVRSLLSALEALPFPIQYFVVCGHNYRLQQQLTAEFQHSRHQVHIKGYIEYVHELMAVSNLLVTKPGGLTVSEALAMELPMVLYKPLPGQEVDNAQFLLESGAAMKADNLQELIVQITKGLQAPEALNAMKQKLRQIQRKEAAADAVDVVMKTRQDVNLQQRAERLVPSWQF